MAKEKIPCAKCGKYFWTSIMKDGQSEKVLCQRCRNKMEQSVHREIKRVRSGPMIRVVEKKVGLRMEVERLRRLEVRYPEVVKKLREEKKNEHKRNKKKNKR